MMNSSLERVCLSDYDFNEHRNLRRFLRAVLGESGGSKQDRLVSMLEVL